MDYVKNYKFGSDISFVFKNKIVPLLKNKKVLDIGCAQGEYLSFCGKDSLGLDISPKNLKEAKKRGFRVKKFDLNRPKSLGEKFDVVLISHVLEHVDSPINVLRFINKSLNKKGLIVVSVPNESSLIHLKYPYFTRNGNHLYSFSISNMTELLLASGFTLKNTFFDYYTALTKKLGIDYGLQLFDVLPIKVRIPFAWAYWFIAVKK